MSKKKMSVLMAIESVLLVLALVIIGLQWADDSHAQTELTRETDPAARYAVTIWRIGEPEWSFGPDHLKVQLSDTENPGTDVSFEADVHSDGGHATYEIEWLENSVKITLEGIEQAPSEYILSFPE